MLHDAFDDETYLNTLEAEARRWAERHLAADAARIARDARMRAVEMRTSRRERLPQEPGPGSGSGVATTERVSVDFYRRAASAGPFRAS